MYIDKKGAIKLVSIWIETIDINPGDSYTLPITSAKKDAMETERIAERVAEESPHAIYVFQDGKLVYFNRAFIDLSGYTTDELGKIEYLSLIHPDFRDDLVRQTQIALSGSASVLSREPEVQILRKNGEIRWVRVRPRVIEHTGKPAVLGMVVDITENKRIEQLLDTSEKRFRSLIENLSDVVWIFDISSPNRLVYVSPSIEKLSGYSVNEALSKTLEQVLTPESTATARDTLDREWTSIINGHRNMSEPVILELKMIRKDGSIVPLEVKYNVMQGTGEKPIQIMAVARDVTERKALEDERFDFERKAQAASRLTTIGEMAAGIAHEINNPLASVVGFCEVLSHRDLPESARKDLDVVCEGSKRIADIVKRLMLFSRQTKPLQRRIDVNEIVQNAIKLREYHLVTGGIEVVTDLSPDLPETMADRGQLTEVFLNIIMNAEEEMSGDPHKSKLLITTKKNNGNIQISFKDNGPGIPAENMKKLFLPFFSTKKAGFGVGLGLSTSYGIITEHDGKIWAESELGKGATFFVQLPILPKRDPLGISRQMGAIPNQTSIARVLVVDDEPSIRQLLGSILIRWGYQVDIVENGHEVIQKIANNTYDVIIRILKNNNSNNEEEGSDMTGTMEVLSKKGSKITKKFVGSCGC